MSELLYQKIGSISFLKQDEFEAFRNLFMVKKLRKRQYLLQAGDVCKYQAFVETGMLRSYTVDEKGSEHILQFASEGWWMADLSSYLTNEASLLNIDALENVSLLLITRPAWEEAMKKFPPLEHYFRIIIQNHLMSTQKRLLQSLAESAEEKYRRFLITYPDCEQRVPQHMVASYIGVTRETLSRVRKSLAIRNR